MGQNQETDRNRTPAPQPQPQPQPQPAPPAHPVGFGGAGVAELGRLLAQHNPPTAGAVIEILRRHPEDRQQIYALLRRECPSIVGQVTVLDTMYNPLPFTMLPPGPPAHPAQPAQPAQPARPPATQEGGGEGPLTAEGDNEELTVGVEGSRRRGNTTVRGTAGVTVARGEDGQAGVRSGQVGGSVQHGPVTFAAGLQLAQAAGGRVTIEGQGSITINLNHWARLRVQGKIDDQGHASASAGLTIDILRPFGISSSAVQLTGTTTTDSDGQTTAGVGVTVSF